MGNPQTTKERLERGFEILERILLRRLVTDSPGLGSSIERAIIDRELRELEQDFRRNPPAVRRPAPRSLLPGLRKRLGRRNP